MGAYWWWLHCFKWPSKRNVQVPSSVLEWREAEVCLMETMCVRGKLHSIMRDSAVGMNVNVTTAYTYL